jgi:hypothetical protein
MASCDIFGVLQRVLLLDWCNRSAGGVVGVVRLSPLGMLICYCMGCSRLCPRHPALHTELEECGVT